MLRADRKRKEQQQQQQQQQRIPRISSVLNIVMTSAMQWMRWVWNILLSLIRRCWSWSSNTQTMHLDTGRKVTVGRQIAVGGFSFVFEATDIEPPYPKYALKRIRCDSDPQLLQSCRKEAGVHRAVSHPSLMPLLGMSIVDNADCFMLFPYMSHSLRHEVNRRTFDRQEHNHDPAQPHAPWNEKVVLQVFWKILQGVQAMHAHNMTHRDIKLENIMFNDKKSRQPVLMDFGSVGPCQQPMATRKQVLQLQEEASMHTTMPYRPPELFEGGVRAGHTTAGADGNGDAVVDYCKVDVWSLGCTLFAMLYGASPFESVFRASTGQLQIVDCTQLKVINSIPVPPSHTATAKWYSAEVQSLIAEMLTQDRHVRPTLQVVIDKVETLIRQQGGQVELDRTKQQYAHHHDHNDENEDHDGGGGIALMGGFV
jgi:serine/threonine kinase 16